MAALVNVDAVVGGVATVLKGGNVGGKEVEASAAVAQGTGLGVAAERVVDEASGEVGRAAQGEVDLVA